MALSASSLAILSRSVLKLLDDNSFCFLFEGSAGCVLLRNNFTLSSKPIGEDRVFLSLGDKLPKLSASSSSLLSFKN